MQEYVARRGIGGWIEEEEEPEETHWDKGTQTEDDVMDQCLPPKKRSKLEPYPNNRVSLKFVSHHIVIINTIYPLSYPNICASLFTLSLFSDG